MLSRFASVIPSFAPLARAIAAQGSSPRRRRARLLLGAFAAGAAGLWGPAQATAGGKREAGLRHNPPLFLDESESLVRISNGSGGYRVEAFGFLTSWSKGDLVRLEVKHKGKLLETIDCENQNASDGVAFACSGKNDLTPLGPIEAQLVYWDDAAEQEYLVRTFTATVQASSWLGDPSWASMPDDLLAAAYARHVPPDEDRGRGLEVEFVFWTSGALPNDVTFRCTVDGKKVPDIEGSQFSPRAVSGAPDTIEFVQQSGSDRQAITWARHRLRWTRVFYGDRATVAKVRGEQIGGPDDTYNTMLIDHPGRWECDVRANGKTGRHLSFTVTAEGRIARHPSQDADGATPTWRNLSQIAMTIPAEAPFDTRIRPEAMKKSMGFGLPWAADPTVAELRAGLPTKAKGTIEPKRSKK